MESQNKASVGLLHTEQSAQSVTSPSFVQGLYSKGFPGLSCDSMILKLLKVPLTVKTWRGDVVLDSGSSYTLLSEKVWQETKAPEDNLMPWSGAPLYLAD